MNQQEYEYHKSIADGIVKSLEDIYEGKILRDSEDEPMTCLDYIIDECLDIELRTDIDGGFRSVKILCCTGGPEAYIDTADGKVHAYGWFRGDEAVALIPVHIVEWVEDNIMALRDM